MVALGLFAVVLTNATLQADDAVPGDWTKMNRQQPRGIEITLKNGEKLEANFMGTRPDNILVVEVDSRGRTQSDIQTIAKSDIERIVATDRDRYEKYVSVGSVIGTGSGITVAAVRHHRGKSNFNGFLIGTAVALTGTVVAALVDRIRGHEVLYRA